MPVYILFFNEKIIKYIDVNCVRVSPETEQMLECRRYIAKYNSTHKHT